MVQGCCVIVDKETGVNCLYFARSGGSGLTVLLGGQGKPVITSAYSE